MRMCSREVLSRRCVLVKRVPEGVEEECLQCVRGVENSHRHNELSIDSGEVRWIVLLKSQEEAEELIRDGYVSLNSDGQKLDLPVGGCPECIIPDEWVENIPTRTSAPLSFDNMLDSIGMESVRCREESKHLDDYVKVEKVKPAEKAEEMESQDKYVPSFAIPAINSPYSQLNQQDSVNSHPYCSLQSQQSGPEEVENANVTSREETETYTPRPRPTRADNSVPGEIRDEDKMKTSVTSESKDDEDDPYQTIDDAALKSNLGHDERPPLPQRLSKEVPSYMEPVSRRQPDSSHRSHDQDLHPVAQSKNMNEKHSFGINHQENASNTFPVNSQAVTTDEHTVKSGSGDQEDAPPVPQRSYRTQSNEVSYSTYIEPVSMEQIHSSPKTNTEPDVPQQALKLEQCHSNQLSGIKPLENTPNCVFPMNSDKFLHTAENNVECMPSFGTDSSHTNQTASKVVINEQRTPSGRSQQEPLAQIVTHRDTGSPIAMHQKPGYQRTANQESGGTKETNQTPDSQRVTAQGIQNQTPRNRETETHDAVYQNVEMLRRPEQGPNPGFMIAPQGQPSGMMNPPNQHGVMPPGFVMGPQAHNQQIQGFPPFQFPGFPPSFFPFQQLPVQGNMVPPNVERIPMPEPEFLPKPTEAERHSSAHRRKEKQIVKSPTEKPSPASSEQRAPAPKAEEIDEEKSFDTVRIRLRKPMSQDAIENYFENKRKSGGGDIKSFKTVKEEDENILEALITFKESNDAKTCLQKKHTIGGENLTVEKYDVNDPDVWEMNKVMVDRLNPVTTDDTLMNFLEPAAGVDPLEVVRGSKPDTVIVVFDEKPDFSKMSKRCNSKKLEGNKLFIQMVEKCRSVYVKDIDDSITYDTVENFFCNKRRSGGGEVEDVDHHPEDGYCVVQFENPADAENVASRKKFTINGKGITVQMFYPCLGLPEQPINWENLPSCIVDCNKHILKFVKNCEAVGKEIEEALHQKFVKVEWPKSKSDLKVKLICSITKEVENARRILKNWEEEAKKSFESLMDKFVVQKHSIIPEAWQDFLDQLKKLHIDHPEKVAVSLEAKEHAVVVVGYEENAEALTRKVLDLIKTEELKIKTQKEKIQKNVPLDFHKCQQLWKTQFQKKIKGDFPGVDVNVEINKQEVNFSGKPSEVNEAMIKMHEYLMNTKSKFLSISKGRHELFKTKEVRDLFLAEMKTKNNKAVWNITEDKVEMTSSNMKMVEEALKLFEECIPEKAIKVKRLVKVLTTPEWQTCVKKLRESYGEKMYILSSASEVCITSTKDIFQPICKEVEQVLEACSKKCCVDRKHVRLSEAQFNYVKYFGEREMKALTKDAEEQDLKIIQNQEDHSIEISGNDEDVRRAKDELQRFVNRLSEDTYSITKPGAKTFFCSGKGLEAIKRTGKATSCIIMNKDRGRHDKEKRESGSFEGHGARSRPKFPVKMAECDLHLGGKKFIVMKGDVTKLKVDVIVNAANEDLDHCGGLALAISRAGGELIQRESKDYIKTNKTVPDGGAVPAKPGNLPCQMLVHAVGPRWQGGNHQEEVNLRKAILNCLELTDRNNYSSIAVPALSAGIFGYPVEQSVETIISSIQFYFKSKEGKSSKIKEIYFCDVDDKIVTAFIRGLRKKFGQDVKEFDGDEGVGDQSPSRDEDSDEESHRKRRSSSGERKKWRRSSSGDREKRRKIEVISGELAKMRVDVIVNSADKSLDLTVGNISKSLYNAGGESLQDECKLKYKNGIEPGKVAITKGGKLRCKMVYHGTIRRWEHGKGDALGKLKDFVKECLRVADTNQMSSIAFPALGTGRLGYPPELAAKTMFRCCRDFHSKNRDSSLKEIFFVIYHKDAEILEAFRSIERESESVGAEASPPDYRQRRERKPSTDTGGGGDRSWKLNKLKVEVRQGDITEEKSDAIVNSITESLDLTKGAASKAILRAAGDSILKECRRGAQSFSAESYVVTSGGNMSCKYIIHVKAQRSAEGWERMVAKALAHADKTGCRSISFPALGTGVRSSDPEEIAKYMFKAMRKYSPENLERVRVVVFQRDMYSVFLSTLKAVPQGYLTQAKDFISGKVKDIIGSGDENEDEDTGRHWRNSHQGRDHGNRGHGSHQNHDHNDRGHRSRQADNRITFLILSNSKDHIKRAKVKLGEVLESEFGSKDIDISKHTLADYQKEEIKKLAKDTEVTIGDKKVLVEGLKTNVHDATLAIYEYLHKVKDKENASRIGKYVKWQYEASPNKWMYFRDEVNYQIETAFIKKEKFCTVQDRSGTEYVIDFKKMEEYEKNKRDKKCKVQRLDRGERGTSSVGLPSKWTSMKSNQTLVEIKLNSGDTEYKEVLQRFQATSQGRVTVSEIRRVQNPFLYQQYAAKRKEIQVKNGKDPQKWLWHGTYPDTVDKIINNGFNRSYCGKHGTSCGAGVYFAVNASYSIGYCAADSHGHKHIFSVQVATGDVCQGNGSLNVLPQKPGAKSHETYDSASDNPSNPVMYVIFHDSQAYPAYHIIFN